MKATSVTGMLHIPGRIAGTLRRRAAEARGIECCGALLGDEGEAVVRCAIQLPNSAAEPHHAYLIRADHVRRAERLAAAAGLRVLGFYHSHPHGDAAPSNADTAAAWPGYVYLIIAADRSGACELAAWRLRHDRSGFEPAPIAEQAA